MCLAVPAQIIDCHDDTALVDLQGNHLEISRVMTPEASRGDWVLVHAGFAISTIDEAEARATWDYLKACYDGEDIHADAGMPAHTIARQTEAAP